MDNDSASDYSNSDLAHDLAKDVLQIAAATAVAYVALIGTGMAIVKIKELRAARRYPWTARPSTED